MRSRAVLALAFAAISTTAMQPGCLGTPPAVCEGPDCAASTTSGTSGTSTTVGTTTAGTGDASTGNGGEIVLRDDEQAEFDAGVYMGTQFDGGLRLVSVVTTGVFESRVFDAGLTVSSWTAVRWRPDRPYGKPLPEGGGTDGPYARGTFDMTDNVLLMHFDGQGTIPDGTTLADASGRGNDGTQLVFSGSAPSYTTGLIGQAMADTIDARISVPIAGAPDLDFGSADFTWAAWLSSGEACEGTNGSANRALMGAQGDDPNPTHMWIGCLRSTDPSCASGGGPSRAGGTLSSNFMDIHTFCGTSTVADGNWHHLMLAVSDAGVLGKRVRLFVDGNLESETNANFDGPFSMFGAAGDFRIGALNNQTTVTVDELAVWRRALDETEATDLWLRGVLHASLSVRVCSQPDCSDDPPFVGPGGDEGVGFTDVDAPQGDLSSLPAGRYIQYRVALDSTSNLPAMAAPTPILTWVEIVGQR